MINAFNIECKNDNCSIIVFSILLKLLSNKFLTACLIIEKIIIYKGYFNHLIEIKVNR